MTQRSFIIALGLMVASCNQQPQQDKASSGANEVLPGTISDDMIDLDTSTASPPLAPVKQAAPDKDAAGDIADKAKAPSEEDAEPAAPAAAPADSGDTE